jgi:glyoxalase family protein
VHHVAWRSADEQDQLAWREAVSEAGLHVTPVLDRQYFRSIYFREPGGVLFEIATDPPGFTRDETVESLGTALKLPPWLEASRERIQAVLPPIEVRSLVSVTGGAA